MADGTRLFHCLRRLVLHSRGLRSRCGSQHVGAGLGDLFHGHSFDCRVGVRESQDESLSGARKRHGPEQAKPQGELRPLRRARARDSMPSAPTAPLRRLPGRTLRLPRVRVCSEHTAKRAEIRSRGILANRLIVTFVTSRQLHHRRTLVKGAVYPGTLTRTTNVPTIKLFSPRTSGAIAGIAPQSGLLTFCTRTEEPFSATL